MRSICLLREPNKETERNSKRSKVFRFMSHSYSFPCCCLVVVVRVILLLLLSARIFAKTKEGFASSENLINRDEPLKNLHSKHTNRRRSNVRRCELRRVLENRRDVVLEVRQRVRRNRSRRAQGAALVQGIVLLLLSLLSLSVRESIDPFSSSLLSLSLLTIFSLFHKRLERGTRCTLKRRNT